MRFVPLFLSLVALGSFSLFAVADETGWTLDWSAGVVGQSPTSEVFPNVRLTTRAEGSQPFRIVGAEGSPVNPFTHLNKALMVERSEGEKGSNISFSLPGKQGYPKGSFEFEVFVTPAESDGPGGFMLSLRTVDLDGTSKKAVSAGAFRFRSKGITFQSASNPEILRTGTKLALGTPNTLKIEWDFDEKKGYSVSLNGKPLSVVKDGADSTLFPLTIEETRSGVREMTIIPQAQGALFIGKVTSSVK